MTDSLSKEAQEQKLEVEERRWAFRKKIAAWSFYASCAIVGVVMALILAAVVTSLTVEPITKSSMLILGFLGFFAGNIMTYIGSAAYSDVRIWRK